jgi:chemotaxis protein methyltransferase CheR
MRPRTSRRAEDAMTVAFARLRRLLRSVAGIALDSDKLYLAESRLAPIMLDNGDIDLAELMRRIEHSGDEQFLQAVIDAMTTNETSFFRDRTPFDLFRRELLPELMERRKDKRRLRIWCAACSTGQEPYSLAMLLEEEGARLKDWTVEILATDISATALQTARRGVYSQFEVQRGLSTQRLLRHFEQHDGNWRANDRLRARVDFRALNLLTSFRHIGPFDIVFCRNVLLYLAPEIRRDVLSRLATVTVEDGWLILGTAEAASEGRRHFAPASTAHCWLLQRRPAAARIRAIGTAGDRSADAAALELARPWA